MKRIVVGLDANGKSCLASSNPPTVFMRRRDAERERVESSDVTTATVEDGTSLLAEIWETDGIPTRGSSEDRAAGRQVFESTFVPGSTRWRLLRNGPGSVIPLHDTPTLSYVVILAGNPVLVLEQEEIELEPGDLVIEPGVKRGWRAGPEGSTMLTVQVGLKDEG